MTVLEILVAARAKIALPAQWTQCAQARDNYGMSILCSSTDAVCWCSTGAIYNVAEMDRRNAAAADELLLAHACTKGHFVFLWNDHPKRTHKQILSAFDRAIATARKSDQ